MPVQKLNRAIMYRAYPTPEQQVLLSKTFGCVRFVWNHMLMDAFIPRLKLWGFPAFIL